MRDYFIDKWSTADGIYKRKTYITNNHFFKDIKSFHALLVDYFRHTILNVVYKKVI